MTMRRASVLQISSIASAVAVFGFATVQAQTPATTATTASATAAAVNLDVLKGAWVRPDGGYMIAIKSVTADGKLEAMYFNPNMLPFAKAQATREGAALRASFELRAGGYDGSTYELTYDPATDRLKGIYYQAVAKQKFDVYFARK
jgi:uncharacterized protein (DUF2147 family)